MTEAAQQNHDELFPGHVSTLKVTDPELIEYFDNFAFDEVLRHGELDTRTRLMVQLASMIASQAVSEYRVMLGAALTGVTPVEVKEIVYHAVPYVGMAKVFDFLHATNDVLKERGVELPLPGQSTTTPEDRAAKGLAVQRRSSRRRRRRWPLRLGGGRRAPHPALSVGQLLRRPLHAHRPRRADAGTPHFRHACLARRVRTPGQGARRREPPCR